MTRRAARAYDRLTVGVAFAIAAAVVIVAPSSPQLERQRLDNGLSVLYVPHRLAPVVAVQAWVRVGSADESAENAGISHVFEHMLFKGTARRGVGEIAGSIEAAGGDINAWTSFDQTVYHVVLSSRHADTAVDVLADALQHSAFDAVELEREREVILEEIRQGADDPMRSVAQALFATAYVAHPYRRPVIGSVETVKSFTRDHLRAFFRRWYVASNVTLVIAGDFDRAAVGRSVSRHFGGMAAGAPARRRVAEPPQIATRGVVIDKDVNESYLAIGYHAPPLRSPEIAALDVAAVVLGQGESSRLSVGLRRGRELVTGAWSYVHSLPDPGMFVVSATTRPEHTADATEAIGAAVARLGRVPITADELEKARRGVEADAIYQRETVQGVARAAGYYEANAGDAAWEEEYLDHVRRLTPERVRAAAARWLVPERATIAALRPRTSTRASSSSRGSSSSRAAAAKLSSRAAAASSSRAAEARRLVTRLRRGASVGISPASVRKTGQKSNVTRATGKAGKRAKHSRAEAIDPDLRREVLPGGLRLLVRRDPSVPVVAMRAVWSGGIRLETTADNGISALLASVITRGCGKRSGDELAAEIDRVAGGLAGVSGKNSFGLRGEWLADSWERGFDLFADCLLTPHFDDDEIARERRRMLDELAARDDSASHVVFRLFAETLYQRHPYRLDPGGSVDAVAALTRDQVRAFYGDHFPASALTIAIVGDVDPDRVVELVRARFAEASAASPPPAPPAAVVETFTGRSAASREVYRGLEREQAQLIIGFPGGTVDSPDRHALEVLVTILGGQGGRLFLELRDRQSLVYRVGAYAVDGLDPGYVAVHLACAPDKLEAAVTAVHGELDRMVADGPTDEEVRRAIEYLIGGHETSLQRRSAVATTLAYHEAYGLGYRSWMGYADDLAAVSAVAVRRVAARYLDWSVAVTATVRPPDVTPSIKAKRAGKRRPQKAR